MTIAQKQYLVVGSYILATILALIGIMSTNNIAVYLTLVGYVLFSLFMPKIFKPTQADVDNRLNKIAFEYTTEVLRICGALQISDSAYKKLNKFYETPILETGLFPDKDLMAIHFLNQAKNNAHQELLNLLTNKGRKSIKELL